MTIPEAGNWTFYSNADDGVLVWINDELIVNNSGIHGMREVSGSVELEQGEHIFRSEFFEHGGGAGHIVSWEGPNQSKQVIPSTSFTRALSSPVRSDVLVHHWDFEAGNGTIVQDLVGEDNLTMTGNPTWQTCLLGNCISLDGIDDILEQIIHLLRVSNFGRIPNIINSYLLFELDLRKYPCGSMYNKMWTIMI